MTKYDDSDPRASDLAGRLELLQTMSLDADRLSHAFERFAKEHAADPVLHSGCRRLATALRDFHSHVMQSFAAMPWAAAK